MKKIIILAISLLMVTAATLRASTPIVIPSYNVPIYEKTLFMEPASNVVSSVNGNNMDEKRDMNIQNSGGGTYAPGGSVIEIYIYRLDDMKKLQGPFFIPEGEKISVRIDHQEWGVTADPSAPTTVSVWID
jgi:hypothetical protein